MLTKGWRQQRRIIAISRIGCHVLWTPVSLFPQTPVIAQCVHEQSGHGGRGGHYAWAQQHGLPLTKTSLAVATVECPICQQPILTLSPHMASFPRVNSQLPGAGWSSGLLPPWKGQYFVPTGIDTYSRYWSAFSACSAYAKTTIHGFTEYLVHCHDFPRSIASDQGTQIKAKEVLQWSHAHGIHLSYYVPQYPEVAGLIEWWHDPLKTQLQSQLGGNTFQGWGKVLQKAAYALNQRPIYGAISYLYDSQDSWV